MVRPQVSLTRILSNWHNVATSKMYWEKGKSVTVSWLKLFPNLSSGLGGMPRSPVRSLRVRSSICSCTGRNQVRKEKKGWKKDNVTKKHLKSQQQAWRTRRLWKGRLIDQWTHWGKNPQPPIGRSPLTSIGYFSLQNGYHLRKQTVCWKRG